MKTPQIITALSGPSSSRRSRQGRGFLALITAFATTLFANFTLAALPAYVQGHYNFSLLPRARMTVLYTNVQAAGDLNIVIVAQRDTVARVKSVRDSMGNKYTPVPPIFSGNFVQSIFYAWNVLPAGAGANTVTVDFDIRATSPDVRILEYSGIVTTANPIVAVADLVGTTSIFAYQFGTSDWSRGGNFILSTVPVLVVSTNMVGPGITTTGPTSGFTQRLLTPGGDSVEDRVITALNSTHSYNAGARLSAVGPWIMQTVVFHASNSPAAALALEHVSTPAFVQGNDVASQTALPSVAAPFKDAQAGGDLNVVIVGQRWNESTVEADPPSDTQGNVYKLAAAPTVIEGPVSLAMSVYYAKNIAPARAGANIVTMKFNGVAVNPDIRILEYSGIDSADPVDVTATGAGNGATSQSGPILTTNTVDLLVGASLSLTSATGPGPNFIQRLLASPSGTSAQDHTVTQAGPYSVSAPLSSPGPWIMNMVAFRAANSHSLAPTPER